MENLSLNIFDRNDSNLTNRYSPQEKIYSIMILDGDKRPRNGEDVPRYTHYSETLNIPVETLRYWYKDREHIFKESEAIGKGIIEAVKLDIALCIPKVVAKLEESLTNNNMKDSDKINLFRELVQKQRLLDNRSTDNKQVNHHHFAPVIPTNLDKKVLEETK